MSIVNLTEILKDAHEKRYAVGNFDAFNMEMVKGILKAAQDTKSPVIIAYGEVFEDYIDVAAYAGMVLPMAKKAGVPVCLHLDHANTFDAVVRAAHAGFTSVMIDASSLPLADNIAITKKVVEACRPLNVSVEAELGHVTQYGREQGTDDYEYTDVAEAVTFTKETGIHALAVAVGTAHGVYTKKPVLKLDRLKQIRQALNVPLVLHGGSGLSDQDFINVIQNGISKVNIYTDLTMAAMQMVDTETKLSFIEQNELFTEAVRQETLRKIKLFGSGGRA
jgi:fructose-bisphosphate aldolase, class II